MDYGIFRSAFMAVGVMCGIVLGILLMKVINKNRKIKTEYDERQEIVRGKGYMLGFYTLVAYVGIMSVLGFGGISMPMEGGIPEFTGIVAAIAVMSVYDIWKDAFWGLNNNRSRYMIIIGVLAVINFIPVIKACMDGYMLENGILQQPFVNLLAAVLLALIAITIGIRNAVDAREQ